VAENQRPKRHMHAGNFRFWITGLPLPRRALAACRSTANRSCTGCSISVGGLDYSDLSRNLAFLRAFWQPDGTNARGFPMQNLDPDLFGFADVAVPRCQRSRVTNDPARRHRGTTANGRRVRDLFLSFMAALGNPVNADIQARALAAAQMRVAAEIAGAKITDGNGDPNEFVRLQNAADRAVRRLGLPAQPNGSQQHVPLRERLKARGAPEANNAVAEVA
jgi:hypothetical protein